MPSVTQTDCSRQMGLMCTLSNLKFLESLWKVLLGTLEQSAKWLLVSIFFPTLLWYAFHKLMRLEAIIFTAPILSSSFVHTIHLVKQRKKANVTSIVDWAGAGSEMTGWRYVSIAESPIEFCLSNRIIES